MSGELGRLEAGAYAPNAHHRRRVRRRSSVYGGQHVFSGLTGGASYIFTETAVVGWSLDSIVCTPSAGTTMSLTAATLTVNLPLGGNVTCTFANTKHAGTGTLRIVKDTQPDDPPDPGWCPSTPTTADLAHAPMGAL